MTLTSPVPTRVEAAASAPAPTARATIALAVLGVFVTYIPITGVSGALSTIAAATGATTSELQWVSDAYVIPMAAAVLSAGVFGDIHGRRRLFGLGMLLTVIGAVVAGLSATLGGAALPVLWFGQAVSGVGAGVLLPTTLALITHAVADPRQRPRYISMWATGIVVGLAIGPILSGLVLAVADWGWIFLPAGLLAVVAGIAAHVALPESRSPEGRHLDWGGQVTASIAIAALIFGVIEGGAAGWGSAPALLAFVVGGAALVGFIIRELRAEKPLMDLRMFRIIGFSAGAISTLAAMFVTVGEMFLLSIYLGSVQPLSALEIGIRLAFVPGVAALVNPIVPRLMARLKPLGVLLLGIVVGIVGMLLLLGVSSTTGFIDLVWRLAVFGVSLALMLTSVSVVAVHTVPWSQASMASATSTALRQFGGALGPAILGSIYVSALSGTGDPSAALHVAVWVNIGVLAVALLAVSAALWGARRSASR